MRPKFGNKLRKLCKISLKNISRNFLLSLATTIMMGLILFIFNVILVLNVLVQASLSELEDKVDLIIYVSEETSLLDINGLIEEVDSIPIVKSVVYTSKGEALKDFLSLYPEKANPFALYGIENPLPANLQIITESPDQHSIVTTYLEGTQYSELLLEVESASDNQIIVSKLIEVRVFTQKLIVGVIVTFIFGSLLMIMNAIHLSIFTRKREIQIMQLVGAQPSMIRFPFLFEGGLYSIVALLFSLLLLMAFVRGTNLSEFTQFSEQFRPLLLFVAEFFASLAIGVLSSYIAITYYLKRTLLLQKG
jgi:cell division transport system permease protein